MLCPWVNLNSNTGRTCHLVTVYHKVIFFAGFFGDISLWIRSADSANSWWYSQHVQRNPGTYCSACMCHWSNYPSRQTILFEMNVRWGRFSAEGASANAFTITLHFQSARFSQGFCQKLLVDEFGSFFFNRSYRVCSWLSPKVYQIQMPWCDCGAMRQGTLKCYW